MSWTALATAYAVVLLAELPDKTMFASMMLTAHTRRPLAVWTGAVSAFLVHVVAAVTIGSFIAKLPRKPIEGVVGVVFIVAAVLLWRAKDETDDEFTDVTDTLSFGQAARRAAIALGLAELGDLTQIATAGLATRFESPLSVGIGAWAALATVAGIAVTGGQWLAKRVAPHVIRRVAAVLFVAFGVVAIVSALR